MSLPRYASYKDSKVPWLGDMPSHWSLCRYKQVFVEREERSETGQENLLSVSAYTGVSPRSEIIEEGEHLSRAESLEGYKVCYPNDLVINIMLAWNRGLAFSDHHGIVSPAYAVFRPNAGNAPRFLDYMVRSDRVTLYYKAFSSGVIDSRLRLYPDTFGSLYCVLPPLQEQLAISTFLDRETGKIDALIAEQEKLIALLAEKRQATIFHAVTHGLNPDAPMKDSGVVWLGEVPAHWAVSALSYLGSIETGSTPDRGEPRFWNGSIPWLKTGEINWAPIREAEEYITEEGAENSAVKLARPGTLLMAMYGQGVTRGRVALLEIEATFNQACAAILFGPRVSPEFGRYFFMAAYVHVRESGNETSQMNLSAGLIAKLKLPVPSAREQADIVRWLDAETTKLDSLTINSEQAIGLMKERRSALIAAAVTGQIDVRGAVLDRVVT